MRKRNDVVVLFRKGFCFFFREDGRSFSLSFKFDGLSGPFCLTSQFIVHSLLVVVLNNHICFYNMQLFLLFLTQSTRKK